MLLHYFGSKENLIGQALAAGRPNVPALLDEATPQALANLARRLWHDMTNGGEQEPRVRLLLQVLALAITKPSPYTKYARAAIADWVQPLASGFRSNGMHADEAQARATTLVSGLRGLALDHYVTGDRARTTAAAEALITTMSRGADVP
jgi:AcrR family transcriptional regulator